MHFKIFSSQRSPTILLESSYTTSAPKTQPDPHSRSINISGYILKCKDQVSSATLSFTLEVCFVLSLDTTLLYQRHCLMSLTPFLTPVESGYCCPICRERNVKEIEADVSFVPITARKSSGQPGRLPPPTLAPPQPPPPEAIERPVGTGAMVARSSDLPYLIVGVVLGSVVLIIVAFIPFCSWRAWSKQSE